MLCRVRMERPKHIVWAAQEPGAEHCYTRLSSTRYGGSATVAMAEVDEELYSRQLYVMGRSAQARVGAASALVCGCSGTGIEIGETHWQTDF